jgi:branched-subunit amino acid transport protein
MTPSTKLWVVIVGIGISGVVSRCSFLFVSETLRLPPIVERALRYAAAAALGAIAVPALVVGANGVDLGPGNHQWCAALIAAAVMWRTRVMLWSMGAGLVAFTALRLLA